MELLNKLEEVEEVLNYLSQGMYGNEFERDAFWDEVSEALYHVRSAIAEGTDELADIAEEAAEGAV